MIFDCEMAEEYIPVHVYHTTGAFVGEIHGPRRRTEVLI